jgi:predicted nucleotidyltransferase
LIRGQTMAEFLRDLFPEFVEDYRKLFGDDLVSVILFGSATGDDFRPGKSDINVMIVLSEAGIDHVDRAFVTVEKWRKKKFAVPLFLTEAYVKTSLDVFPIEYLDLRENHLLVHGKDTLEGLSFQPESVRLQCEREVKGKLLLLRAAFMESAGKGKVLRQVIRQSIQAFVAIFKALLFLKGLAVPRDKRDVIRVACEAFDLDAGLFERLLDVREEKVPRREDELKGFFRDYLREVRNLSQKIDTLGV